MRAVIFVNGEIDDYAVLAKWLRPNDYLIGADGGTAHCLALDCSPSLVVGDLDSLAPEQVARLEAEGTHFERHPPAKNETDLELAIERAIHDGAAEILILGALGGRLDQTLANLLILVQRVWPVSIRVADGSQVACVVRGGETLVLEAGAGATVSMIPLSAQVTGITYHGMEYPLHNATLALGSTRGISNVVVETPATVQIAGGILLVVQSL